MIALISAIVIGFFVGLIARAIHPGTDSAGFFVTVLLGIAGSLLATYTGQWLGWYASSATAGFVMSTLGAIIVLAIYNRILQERHKAAC